MSRLRLVNPLGKEQLVSGLELKSTVVRFVRVPGTDRLARWLDWRESAAKLRAASNPAKLLMFRLLASKLVRVSRSCWVNGPAGFCSAARTAALRPGSGRETSWAAVEITKPVKISATMP